jgi:hypothetical protein
MCRNTDPTEINDKFHKQSLTHAFLPKVYKTFSWLESYLGLGTDTKQAETHLCPKVLRWQQNRKQDNISLPSEYFVFMTHKTHCISVCWL